MTVHYIQWRGDELGGANTFPSMRLTAVCQPHLVTCKFYTHPDCQQHNACSRPHDQPCRVGAKGAYPPIMPWNMESCGNDVPVASTLRSMTSSWPSCIRYSARKAGGNFTLRSASALLSSSSVTPILSVTFEPFPGLGVRGLRVGEGSKRRF